MKRQQNHPSKMLSSIIRRTNDSLANVKFSTTTGNVATSMITVEASSSSRRRSRPSSSCAAAAPLTCYKLNGICTNFTTNRNLLIVGLIFIIVICNDIADGALRNVNLIIEPPAVRRGQHAILRCMYDLEGAPLYSAKFYRGQLEFYRYTPGEFPNTKVFPFPGIHVDVTSSNATQVLIRNVGFGLSGNFSCEVTADAPLFSTATAIGTMQVVELPDKRPQLFTEHTRYEPGDVLRANCSTPPSRPRAELKFTINNMVINNAETQYIRTIDNLIASRISLKLQLQGIHFSSANPSIYGQHNVYTAHGMNSVHNHGGSGGGLLLRCTATIGELYQEYKEIELGTPQKDPIPARVTLSSGSSVKNFFSSYFSSGATMPSLMNVYKLLLFTCLMHFSLIGTLIIDAKSINKLWQHVQRRYKYKQQQQEQEQHSCCQATQQLPRQR
ncbi:uncharacterized protein LOC119640736 [Glossina fuscipes]|uniref:Uncharacterized protein LOC119640736 n=1 Tax=Glossina fuscipes TaxID=7396 RepID=A0A9C5Z8B5_9MUSC|nr:uncharacterized protein LOC119640736 [Glossina fuscipes]